MAYYEYIDEKSGLSFVEILMLFYAHRYSTDTAPVDYERFWTYIYGVDPENILFSLYDNGYIELDGIKTTLDHFKVPELKRLLNRYDLPVTGSKNTLILRLLENLTYDELDFQAPHRYYVLTEKGESVIRYNELVLFAHRNPNLDIDIYKARKYHNINDYLWSKFNNDSMKYMFNEEWGLYRNCRFEMAKILYKEKRYKYALRFFVEVCYCDTLEVEKYNSLAPGIIKYIANIKEALKYSFEELQQEIILHIETLNLPPNLYSSNDLASFIILLIKSDN